MIQIRSIDSSRLLIFVLYFAREPINNMTDGNNIVPENGDGVFKKPPVGPPADKSRQSLREQDQLPVGYLDAFG